MVKALECGNSKIEVPKFDSCSLKFCDIFFLAFQTKFGEIPYILSLCLFPKKIVGKKPYIFFSKTTLTKLWKTRLTRT